MGNPLSHLYKPHPFSCNILSSNCLHTSRNGLCSEKSGKGSASKWKSIWKKHKFHYFIVAMCFHFRD
uniref:Uncharacterized protein n=1 Tax=Rhizophora mucronata TaxID=61149 RepID=A0A2P2PPZ0_RHIMU